MKYLVCKEASEKKLISIEDLISSQKGEFLSRTKSRIDKIWDQEKDDDCWGPVDFKLEGLPNRPLNCRAVTDEDRDYDELFAKLIIAETEDKEIEVAGHYLENSREMLAYFIKIGNWEIECRPRLDMGGRSYFGRNII